MTTNQAHINWNSSLQASLPDLWIDGGTDTVTSGAATIDNLRRHGFALLRGLGADDAERELVTSRLNRLGEQLGTIVRQNQSGSLLEDIRDFSDTDAFDNRGYRSPGELTLHTDPPTLIALHCLAPARRGGENQLVNIEAMHGHAAAHRPDLLARLFRGFHYWIPSETQAGAGEASRRARPILMRHDGRISCVYYRPYIEAAARALHAPLSAPDVEALDYFDALAGSAQFQIRLTLAAGDTLVLHNRAVMHARGAYEDWPEPQRRRHLLRLWIDAPGIRPTAAEHDLGDFFAQAESNAMP